MLVTPAKVIVVRAWTAKSLHISLETDPKLGGLLKVGLPVGAKEGAALGVAIGVTEGAELGAPVST